MEDEKTSNDATTFGQMTLGQMAIGRTNLGKHCSAPGRVYGGHLYLLN